MIELGLERGQAYPDRVERRPQLGQIQLEPRDALFQFERLRKVARLRANRLDGASTPTSQDRAW